MKKILAVALASILLISATVFGTVTYLTDVESDVNVMTMGDVEIEQIEMQRAKDENGNWIVLSDADSYGYYPDTLEKFVQNQRLLPAFYDNANKTTVWDDRAIDASVTVAPYHMQSWAQVGAPGANQLFDDTVRNVLDKFVFVRNTGTEDAYYRTVIAIECPKGVDPKLIHTNVNSHSSFTWEAIGLAEIDGVQYYLQVATYTEVLKPGETSRPSLLQVFLDPKTSSSDVAAFDGAMEIFVVSQAMQTQGFEKAGALVALDEAFGDLTIGQHPWTEESGTFFELPDLTSGVMTFDKDGLYYIQDETIYNGFTTTDLLFDGNGATIEVIASDRDNIGWTEDGPSSSFSIFASEKGSNATVTLQDMTVTGNATMIFGMYVDSQSNWHNTVLENVHIVDNETVTSLRGPGTFVNSDGTEGGVFEMAVAACIYGKATLNNCSVKGTTYSQMEADDFGAFVPLYDLAVVNYSNTVINGGEYGSILTWQQLHLEINDADVELIDSYVNRRAVTDTVLILGDGTTVGTLNIHAYKDTTTGLWSSTKIEAGATVENLVLTGIFDANDRACIVIEDGATIGSYTVNGTVMTETEFNAWLTELAVNP